MAYEKNLMLSIQIGLSNNVVNHTSFQPDDLLSLVGYIAGVFELLCSFFSILALNLSYYSFGASYLAEMYFVKQSSIIDAKIKN